jgi:hypothetical protein
MKPGIVVGETRRIGAPRDWDPSKAECGALSVVDMKDDATGHNMMISAWSLEPGDLEKLARGAPIHLAVFGTVHPVVSVYVGNVE